MPTDSEPEPPLRNVHPAALSDEALLKQCDVERLRRGGPGGQHRNKVETGIRIVHRTTGQRGEAFERRSQEANRAAAIWRLRMELALHVRRAEFLSPSALWSARFPHGRIVIAAANDDLPALLAETLDVLARADWHVADAAAALGTTPSQLIKLVQLEPRAMIRLNDERTVRNLHPLR